MCLQNDKVQLLIWEKRMEKQLGFSVSCEIAQAWAEAQLQEEHNFLVFLLASLMATPYASTFVAILHIYAQTGLTSSASQTSWVPLQG